MAYDLTKLADVPIITSTDDSTNFIVEQDDQIVKVSSNSIVYDDLTIETGLTVNGNTYINGDLQAEALIINDGDNIYHPEVVENKQLSTSSLLVGTQNDINYPTSKNVRNALDTKQATLVSGVNIKTINDNILLGTGDIDIISQIPIASNTQLGKVKIDNSTIKLNGSNQLYVNNSFEYVSYGAAQSLDTQEKQLARSNIDAVGTSQLNDYIQKIGGTMSGQLNMGGYRIANVGAPINNTDVATKQYVDNKFNQSVPVASKTSTGVVRVGSGLDVSGSGLLSLKYASATEPGGILASQLNSSVGYAECKRYGNKLYAMSPSTVPSTPVVANFTNKYNYEIVSFTDGSGNDLDINNIRLKTNADINYQLNFCGIDYDDKINMSILFDVNYEEDNQSGSTDITTFNGSVEKGTGTLEEVQTFAELFDISSSISITAGTNLTVSLKLQPSIDGIYASNDYEYCDMSYDDLHTYVFSQGRSCYFKYKPFNYNELLLPVKLNNDSVILANYAGIIYDYYGAATKNELCHVIISIDDQNNVTKKVNAIDSLSISGSIRTNDFYIDEEYDFISSQIIYAEHKLNRDINVHVSWDNISYIVPLTYCNNSSACFCLYDINDPDLVHSTFIRLVLTGTTWSITTEKK